MKRISSKKLLLIPILLFVFIMSSEFSVTSNNKMMNKSNQPTLNKKTMNALDTPVTSRLIGVGSESGVSGVIVPPNGVKKLFLMHGMGYEYSELGGLFGSLAGKNPIWQQDPTTDLQYVANALNAMYVNGHKLYDAVYNPVMYKGPYWTDAISEEVVAKNLATYINTNTKAGDTIDVIGHSNGGVVVRTFFNSYWKSIDTSTGLGKIINLDGQTDIHQIYISHVITCNSPLQGVFINPIEAAFYTLAIATGFIPECVAKVARLISPNGLHGLSEGSNFMKDTLGLTLKENPHTGQWYSIIGGGFGYSTSYVIGWSEQSLNGPMTDDLVPSQQCAISGAVNIYTTLPHSGDAGWLPYIIPIVLDKYISPNNPTVDHLLSIGAFTAQWFYIGTTTLGSAATSIPSTTLTVVNWNPVTVDLSVWGIFREQTDYQPTDGTTGYSQSWYLTADGDPSSSGTSYKNGNYVIAQNTPTKDYGTLIPYNSIGITIAGGGAISGNSVSFPLSWQLQADLEMSLSGNTGFNGGNFKDFRMLIQRYVDNPSPTVSQVIRSIIGPSSVPFTSTPVLTPPQSNEYKITLNPVTPVNNYQVKVNLDATFPYTQSEHDGGDIRFYTTGGVSLPYWIESWNAGLNHQSTIWVKVPNAGTSTITMTYGDLSLVSNSNGTAVFNFFDDFTGTNIATTKWNAIQQDYSNITESGGMASLETNIAVDGTNENCLMNTFQGFSDFYNIGGATYGSHFPNGLIADGSTVNSTVTTIVGGSPVKMDQSHSFNGMNNSWATSEYDRIDASHSAITVSVGGSITQFSWTSPAYIPAGNLPVNIMTRGIWYGPGYNYAAQLMSKQSFGIGCAVCMQTYTSYDYSNNPGASPSIINVDWVAVRNCSLNEPIATLSAVTTQTMTGSIGQGQAISQPLSVIRPNILRAEISLKYGGSNVSLIIVDPNGNLVSPGSINVVREVANGTENWSLYNPLEGEYTIYVLGVNIPNGPENFTVTTSVQDATQAGLHVDALLLNDDVTIFT